MLIGELPSSLQDAQPSIEHPPVHVFGGSLTVIGEGSTHADSLLSTDGQIGQPRAPPPSTTDGDEASVASSGRDMVLMEMLADSHCCCYFDQMSPLSSLRPPGKAGEVEAFLMAASAASLPIRPARPPLG